MSRLALVAATTCLAMVICHGDANSAKAAILQRAALGVELVDTPNGVTVTAVYPASPASRAGVLAGDIILSIDGQSYPTVRSVRRALSEMNVEEEVELELDRRGRPRRITTTLASWAKVFGTSAGSPHTVHRPIFELEQLRGRVNHLEEQLESLRNELRQLKRQSSEQSDADGSDESPNSAEKAPLSAGVIDDTDT